LSLFKKSNFILTSRVESSLKQRLSIGRKMKKISKLACFDIFLTVTYFIIINVKKKIDRRSFEYIRKQSRAFEYSQEHSNTAENSRKLSFTTSLQFFVRFRTIVLSRTCVCLSVSTSVRLSV